MVRNLAIILRWDWEDTDVPTIRTETNEFKKFLLSLGWTVRTVHIKTSRRLNDFERSECVANDLSGILNREKRDDCGLVTVYYSGHGSGYEQNLELWHIGSQSGCSWENVAAVISNYRKNWLVLIDCCFSGKAIDIWSARSARDRMPIRRGNNIAILTATSSKAYTDNRPEEWTATLTEAIKEIMSGGIAGVSDVARRVVAKTRGQRKDTGPQYETFGRRSEIVIENEIYLNNIQAIDYPSYDYHEGHGDSEPQFTSWTSTEDRPWLTDPNAMDTSW